MRASVVAGGVGLLGVVAPVVGGRSAFAGKPLDGLWSMSDVRETFTVQQWAAPCGPPPVSGTMIPGGAVSLHADAAGELSIAAAHRTLRTDLCLDPMPTLAREAHSRDGRAWRTRCATPSNDPRHAVVNTAYFLAPSDDSISVAETGRYEFAVSSERCVADVSRSASLTRLVAAAAAPLPPDSASASPSASAAPARSVAATSPAKAIQSALRPDCSSPGPAARLEVRPSRKLLRVGETFAFRGLVVDANGCAAPTYIQWSVGPVTFRDGASHAARPAVDGEGRLTVPASDFGDATFDVIATAAGHSARAAVETTTPQNYEAWLAQSGLDPNGERDEPSVVALATSSIGGRRTRAEDGAARRRNTFLLIVAGLVAGLGVVAVGAARRARKSRRVEQAAQERHAAKMREYERQKREREERHAEQMRAHVRGVAIAQQQAAAAAARGLASGPTFCPSCRREFAGGTVYCPYDANRLVAIAGHEDLVAGPAGGICPTCKRGFNPGVRVCPHDGEELVPAVVAAALDEGARPAPAMPAATAAAAVATRGKICPTCGGRFDGTAAFCGQDGTQLVLLN